MRYTLKIINLICLIYLLMSYFFKNIKIIIPFMGINSVEILKGNIFKDIVIKLIVFKHNLC